ncbi:hypothetical protein KBZ18_05545 [Synechococcus sp. Cruz-9H2]|uniref:hypothetical protein n=1 Tax=unclassified Synechococcus TaxID=2626047 RepID=UPI0020CF5FBB|nr:MULTISPECIES: hypothetical protein [unclassified Synechococcus]MCP9818954.1 hypothetical protein [Synechococcus sp. Cruz-9H2]MCP9843458.1 hypothetical protein [Synechococcus sp. Edmonson 11F2]MCP9855160.1 hypothetical protein [Synechococcus sp. Cruz-9C9]MCP9862868.1 hypothetical protein [Synechococcus sp. Cruz-7E5]MCP9869864.1 hypothetical protein [Synechococcus sp. Cruz-7B9]
MPRSISIRASELAAGEQSLPPLGTTTQRRQRERFLAGTIDGLLGAFGAALVLSAAGRIAGIGGSRPTFVQAVVAGLGLLLLTAGWRRLGRGLLEATATPKGQRQLERVVGWFPFGAMALFAIYRLGVSDVEAYKVLVSEGSVVEWLTFLFFIAAGCLFLLTGRGEWVTDRAKGRLGLGALFIALGVVNLLIGFEEMSWGQTIFNWETPELFVTANAQKETNLHNLALIQDRIWTITAAVCVGATLLVAVRRALEARGHLIPRSLADVVLPHSTLLGYFLFAALLYVPVALIKHDVAIPVLVTRDQEVAEAFFSLGVLLHAGRCYLRWARPA